MRDQLCKIEYLKNKIDFNREEIIEEKKELNQLLRDVKEGIQRYPRRNEEIIYDTKVGLFRLFYDMIRAKYSLGLECETLEEDYLEMISFVSEIGCEKIGYVHFIQVFAIGILLEMPSEDLAKLVRIADEVNLDDCLFDFLVCACGLKRKIVSERYHKENPYAETAQIINTSLKNKEVAAKALEIYMEKKWFQGHYDYDWKNAHKRAGYVGIWSFETAALAKILKLDDNALSNCNHYPYDLAHYKNGIFFSPNNTVLGKKEKDDYVACNENRELEQIIPSEFRECVDEIIRDYKKLDDLDIWDKYDLKDIWYTYENFCMANKDKKILGNIIVNVLVEKGYVVQLDYKADIKDYISNVKNYWNSEPTKVIRFELNNDQNYYSIVPRNASLEMMYEVELESVDMNL